MSEHPNHLVMVVLAVTTVGLAPHALADDPVRADCLVFRSLQSNAVLQVSGILTNNCGKAVTAYALDMIVHLADGTSTNAGGMGEGFLPGLDFPQGSGFGALQPGGERKTPVWPVTLSDEQRTNLQSVEVRVGSVIFDDASAVGADSQITGFFANHRGDLEEWRFWQQSFAKYKTQLQSAESLTLLYDWADVPKREQAVSDPRRPRVVSFHAEELFGTLQGMDNAVRSGRVTRSQAIQMLEEHLATLVRNGEQQA